MAQYEFVVALATSLPDAGRDHVAGELALIAD